MPGHSGVPSCALFNRLCYKIGKKDSFAKAEVKSKTKKCKRRSDLKRNIIAFKVSLFSFGFLLNKI